MAIVKTDDEEIITAINITPLVDIFLVLLIIFMITSSIVNQKQISLNSPKAVHAGTKVSKTVGLEIDKEGVFYLDGIPMDSINISKHLKIFLDKNPEFQVLIAADKDLAYQKVINAIDLVRAAGVNKYALKVIRP